MNSKMDSNLTSMWVNFFTAAGIPSDVSATYALTFTENRIQNDMLLDLNKEYLRDMGIGRMGDVIAILRHAKQVHESTARDKVLNTTITASTVATAKVPVAAITGRSTVTTQPSSPASRILGHYTRNPQAPESPNSAQAHKRKSVESGTNTEGGIKKARSIRFASPTPAKPTVKEGASNKTVFARLGNSEPKAVSTKETVKPIYARLGTKSEDQAIPIDKDALKYEGILKANPAPKKLVTVTTSKNIRKISCTMRADEAPVSIKEKLSILKSASVSGPKSVKFSNHVQYKEIEPNQKASIKAKPTAVFNKPERRLSMPESNSSVKARLGTAGKNVNNLTITRNVFNRLGV